MEKRKTSGLKTENELTAGKPGNGRGHDITQRDKPLQREKRRQRAVISPVGTFSCMNTDLHGEIDANASILSRLN